MIGRRSRAGASACRGAPCDQTRSLGRTRRRMARLRGFCGFEPRATQGAIHAMGSALPNSFPKAEPLLLGCAESPGFSSYAPHGRLARSHEGCEPGRARPPGAPCLPAHPSLLLLYACSRGPSRRAFRALSLPRAPHLLRWPFPRLRHRPPCAILPLPARETALHLICITQVIRSKEIW